MESILEKYTFKCHTALRRDLPLYDVRWGVTDFERYQEAVGGEQDSVPSEAEGGQARVDA